MTYPKEIVTKVLHLRASGLSLSQVREYIYQHEGYYLYDSGYALLGEEICDDVIKI